MSPIVIVGGGIGGMALAAALTRLGESPLVLERAPELGEVGSGLGVLPSAVRALEAIGVSSDLVERAAPLRRIVISNHRGRALVEINLSDLFAGIGRTGYIMHRAALHASLCACVDPKDVRTGATVAAIEEGDGELRVHVEGDTKPIRARIVVGADGLRSSVRKYVLDDGPPRYAGETIFRGIADVQLDPLDVCREVFGPGYRLGCYDLGGGRTYWWATSPVAEDTLIPPQERGAYLLERLSGWPFDIPALIAKTPPEMILQNDIFDRAPARTWHRGRAVLLGDAAHPTTPNMGLGACMAIEDAVVLARSIARSENYYRAAFQNYERARRRRTARIMLQSRLWGRIGLWQSRTMLGVRDAMYRLVPRGWLEGQLRDQYSYDPGGLTDGLTA